MYNTISQSPSWHVEMACFACPKVMSQGSLWQKTKNTSEYSINQYNQFPFEKLKPDFLHVYLTKNKQKDINFIIIILAYI